MESSAILKERIQERDWEELRKLGHMMVDDMLHYFQGTEARFADKNDIKPVKDFFQSDLPENPSELEEVYNQFKDFILPLYGKKKGKDGIRLNSTMGAQAMLAGMLASVINPEIRQGEYAARHLDKQVVEWCGKIIRYAEVASGALVSGTSMANTSGLLMARNATHVLIRNKGIKVFDGKLVMYASEEAHFAIKKAAEIMGIGVDSVRKVRVNEDFEMDLLHLEELINNDEAEGNIPFCVVATVGTHNTGAIDPLEGIARLCRHKKIWLHVDGSFGVLARMIPEYEEKLHWIDQADSIAFDLQKWLFLPYETGCILVKDKTNFRTTFSEKPEHISLESGDYNQGLVPLSSFQIELSKGFQALKVWMTLKENGTAKFARLMKQNIEQARFLELMIMKRPVLELMAPVSMNIVCFRYNSDMMAEWELNRLNREIAASFENREMDILDTVTLKNKFCFRLAIHNEQSVWEDYVTLVDEIIGEGDRLQNLRNIYQVYSVSKSAQTGIKENFLGAKKTG